MTALRLLNTSTELADTQLITMAQVGQAYLNLVAAAWGLDEPTVVSGEDGQAPSDFVVTLSDETDSGVLGYHADPSVPNSVICVGEILGYGGGVFQAEGVNPAVVTVLCHELAEMLVDPLATMWEPRGDGTFVALEVCDPCQETFFELLGASVPDFVLPGWFLRSGVGKVDYLGRCKQGSLSSGGYMVIKAADGSTSQQFGASISGLWNARALRQKRRH